MTDNKYLWTLLNQKLGYPYPLAWLVNAAVFLLWNNGPGQCFHLVEQLITTKQIQCASATCAYKVYVVTKLRSAYSSNSTCPSRTRKKCALDIRVIQLDITGWRGICFLFAKKNWLIQQSDVTSYTVFWIC